MYLTTDAFTATPNPAVCGAVIAPEGYSRNDIYNIVQVALNQRRRGFLYEPGGMEMHTLALRVADQTGYPIKDVTSILGQVNTTLYNAISPEAPSPFTSAPSPTVNRAAAAPSTESPRECPSPAEEPTFVPFWKTETGRTIKNAAIGGAVVFAVTSILGAITGK